MDLQMQPTQRKPPLKFGTIAFAPKDTSLDLAKTQPILLNKQTHLLEWELAWEDFQNKNGTQLKPRNTQKKLKNYLKTPKNLLWRNNHGSCKES